LASGLVQGKAGGFGDEALEVLTLRGGGKLNRWPGVQLTPAVTIDLKVFLVSIPSLLSKLGLFWRRKEGKPDVIVVFVTFRSFGVESIAKEKK